MDLWARRDVLRGMGRVPLWAGIAAVLAACGDSSGSKESSTDTGSTGGTTTPTTTCADTISANHGHTACIPQSVLDNPQPSNVITLDGPHTHEITLTDAEVLQIKNNAATVLKTSSTTNSHTHDVTYVA